MSSKPLIGITGPNRGGRMAWYMTALAVRRCGAAAVRITPAHRHKEQQLDGIIIGGGTDVDPFHYGETRLQEPALAANERYSALDWLVGLLVAALRTLFASHSKQPYDPDRDHMEQHLVQYALYNGLPILGICRGAQLMNVTLGGSLHQHIGHFYTEDTGNIRSILPRKSISLSPGSRLQQLLQVPTCQVNALHHQSIKDLGDELLVSASESSGVVQAIERRGHPFFVGVQWHPEYMPQSRLQQRLFSELVDSTRQDQQRVAY